MGRNRQYIVDLKDKYLPVSVGKKARNLRKLIDKGFPVPQTHVCTWEAFLHHQQGNRSVFKQVKDELSQKLNRAQYYAVRSSANIEDGLDHSFAGQFKTILDVRSFDNIIQSICEIWSTIHSQNIQTYLKKNSIDPKHLKMAVIIQEMVSPVFSGVSFSKNPITGMDEIVVESVHGSGEALVQEGVTPHRWVYRWGEWVTQPEQAAIDQHLIQHVIDQTQAIAKALKKDVDLEWVCDGQNIYWLQAREITSIKHINVYSNAIAKEQLPGIIKPLIWSINIPLVNGAWINLLSEVIGKNDIDPYNLAKSFYYRAYYNMGVLGQIFESLGMPPESLEIMMGLGRASSQKFSFKPTATMLRLTPRLIRFTIDKWCFASKIDKFLPAMEAEYKTLPLDQSSGLDEQELIETIDHLFTLTKQAAYYNIVGPLLMMVYNGILRSQLKEIGVDFAGFELMQGMDELAQVEPTIALTRLGQQFKHLDEIVRAKILGGTYQEFQELPDIDEFQQAVANFIEQFGHLSDSNNDFSAPPWRENPDLILQLIPAYSQTEARVAAQIDFDQFQVTGWRRWWLRHIYHRARRFRLYRERINSLYSYGYGLFRVYFLALGQHFVQRSVLALATDIFYLNQQEVREIAACPNPEQDYVNLVDQRKQEIEQYRDTVLPTVIYGDETPPLDLPAEQRLKGIATSRGYYTGPVKVVDGLGDFSKLEDGDVLVVPYTDVGWTPLFARAGAVISESGGMLSHSSIIAREYNIPAIVSVDGATQLSDNILVTLDGYKGEIIIHDSGGRHGGFRSTKTG